jgi:hypothetical protein
MLESRRPSCLSPRLCTGQQVCLQDLLRSSPSHWRIAPGPHPGHEEPTSTTTSCRPSRCPGCSTDQPVREPARGARPRRHLGGGPRVWGSACHSRYCVMAAVVERATARAVCLAFAQGVGAPWGAGGGDHRQRQAVHRSVQPVRADPRGGVVRQDLPPQRHDAPAHCAGIAEPEREDGALPRHLPPRTQGWAQSLHQDNA